MSEWGKIDYANNKPKFLLTGAANSYFSNTDTILIDSTRMANTIFGTKGIAHAGWVKVNKGTGPVKSIAVSNVNANLTYSNAYVSFVGENPVSAANAYIYTVGAAANSVVLVLNSGGTYGNTPAASISGTNNATLLLTLTMGGRANRYQPEVLVALSEQTVTDSTSGLPFVSGV
jgi:hypothetical protein